MPTRPLLPLPWPSSFRAPSLARCRIALSALGLTTLAACAGSPRSTTQAPPAAGLTIDVMTFNVRYAHTRPPDLWPGRLPVIVDLVARRQPDVIGTQEGLYHQVRDLEKALPDYAWIGTGRDGGSRGEFMAVFFRRDRVEPLEYDHYWLSDTPALPGSKTWGNNYPRMVTAVRFRDLATGTPFLILNTHFDHESQHARERSAALILDRLAPASDRLPVILLGDFNADAGASTVHERLTAPGAFIDSWAAAGNADTLGTFHAFEGIAAASGRRRIDWVLYRGPVSVISSEIVTDAVGGQLPSDHFPVTARLRLATGATAAPDPRQRGQSAPDDSSRNLSSESRPRQSRAVGDLEARLLPAL